MDAFDDDELARAIAASLEDHTRATTTTKAAKAPVEVLEISDDEEPAPAPPPPPPEAKSSFLSERAQMEKERRERARKYRQAAGLKDDDDGSDGASTSRPPPPAVKTRPTPTPAPAQSSSGDQLFFDGELRPIAVQGCEPRRDGKPTFRLTQALGKKSDISFAILSTYAHDIPWINSFFEPSVPVIFLTQPETNSTEVTMKYVLPNWIKVNASLGHMGCQHMKFMLIFYKTGRLRVVISTANLVQNDYRDIENLLWLQDIPPRPIAIQHNPKEKEDFPSIMQRVLHALGTKDALALTKTEHPMLPIGCIEDLRCRWDWAKVKVHLIPSIAGKHEGWLDILFIGHVRLMKAIYNLGLTRKPGQLTIEYQGSSLGTYSASWLNEFYYSCLGQSPGDYLDKPKSALSKRPVMGQIDIIFPTKATVKASQYGEPGGGTTFCRRNGYDSIKKHGSKVQLRDSKSKAGNTLMHTKMMLGMFTNTDDSDSDMSDVEVLDADGKKEAKPIAWAYVGSHNFTPSAWGNVSGSSFNPVINIRNYELGIVFPIRSKAELEKVTFWERPARKYGSGDEPWIQGESAFFAQLDNIS